MKNNMKLIMESFKNWARDDQTNEQMSVGGEAGAAVEGTLKASFEEEVRSALEQAQVPQAARSPMKVAAIADLFMRGEGDPKALKNMRGQRVGMMQFQPDDFADYLERLKENTGKSLLPGANKTPEQEAAILLSIQTKLKELGFGS